MFVTAKNLSIFLVALFSLNACIQRKSSNVNTSDAELKPAAPVEPVAGQNESATPSLKLLWTLETGVDAPESAYFHKENNTIYVSSVAGNPTEKDGNGWISTVSVDGELTNEKWFVGDLNAPKGLRAHGNLLWIADIDRLLAVSLDKAKLVYEFKLPEAKFLNDVTVDSSGNVFVSDMFGNAVYRAEYQSGKYLPPKVFLQGEDVLQGPNGLAVLNDDLIVGRWGWPINADFSSQTQGSLLKVNLQSKKSVEFPALGNIDGIEVVGDDQLLVSDYMTGKVFQVQLSTGKAELVLQLKPGAADLGYNAAKGVMYVPLNNGNALQAFQK